MGGCVADKMAEIEKAEERHFRDLGKNLSKTFHLHQKLQKFKTSKCNFTYIAVIFSFLVVTLFHNVKGVIFLRQRRPMLISLSGCRPRWIGLYHTACDACRGAPTVIFPAAQHCYTSQPVLTSHTVDRS